jgi:soluble lytic murein transglycosylase-like protein
MQLMPATAATLGVRDAFDPQENIEGGVRHLRWLMERFDHDVPTALAAYNAGEGAVLKHGRRPPSRETREYVKRVMARMNRSAAKS